MTAKWYSASLKARPIFNICPRFGRQPNISLELDPDIGSYLLWSQPGVCYLLLAVCFLLMNYSTALHPIKNFSKALLGLINEEPGVIENLDFSVRSDRPRFHRMDPVIWLLLYTYRLPHILVF